MANRQLFASSRGRLASPANARNEAGGLAYAFSPKAALAQQWLTTFTRQLPPDLAHAIDLEADRLAPLARPDSRSPLAGDLT